LERAFFTALASSSTIRSFGTKHIVEWSTGAVGKNSDEVQAYIADLGTVNVAVSKEATRGSQSENSSRDPLSIPVPSAG